MISTLTALLIVFAAVIGSTAMIGIIAYLLHRIRQIESGSAGGDSGLLAQRMDAMSEELLALQDELKALSERADFTEKLLSSGEDEGAAPDGSE